MSTHRISVTVDDGAIQVNPETLVMTAVDEVSWTGTNARRFSIEFDGAGPFDQRELAHDSARSPQRPRAKGRFKYSVVSEDDPGLRLDPVIIVDEPPSGPNP